MADLMDFFKFFGENIQTGLQYGGEAQADIEYYRRTGRNRQEDFQRYQQRIEFENARRMAELADKQIDNLREDAKARAEISKKAVETRLKELEFEDREADLIKRSGGMSRGETTPEMFQFMPAASKPLRAQDNDYRGTQIDDKGRVIVRSGMGSVDEEYERQLREKGKIEPGVYLWIGNFMC